MLRSSCLVCASADLHSIIDLGIQPFADTFIAEDRLDEPDLIFPLVCDLCSACGHIQTKYVTDPAHRYSGHAYSYTSSNSGFARNHWQQFAQEVPEKTGLPSKALIVEVGSNDGFLAEQFQMRGHRVIGVDASSYMAGLANERKVETVVGVFGPELAERLLSEYGRAQLIVANNVFNHSDTPVDFARAAAALLAPGGTFVFEAPYWCIGIRDGRFDQIYHEHVSYFTVRSAAKILEQAEMRISGVEIVDYHGGSLRIYARRREDASAACVDAEQMIEEERSSGIFEKKTYDIFMQEIMGQRDRFLQYVYGLKSEGGSIVGVGAAAKANTFLNYYNMDSTVIDYVTDASVHKQGKYTPLTRIPICGDEVFADYGEVYALILSWNIADTLKQILLNINPKIQFIKP